MSDLLERLEDAEAPDGRLDHDILISLGCRYEHDWGPEYYWPDGARFFHDNLTASVDAGLALMAHLLPGWTRSVDATLPSAGIDVQLHADWPRDSKTAKMIDAADICGTHALEPIATIIAVLKANNLQKEREHG